MFTGIQILEPRIFDYIPRGVFSHSTTDVYPQAMEKGERVAAHVASGNWYELSTLQRYLDISLAMLAERGEAFTAGARCTSRADADGFRGCALGRCSSRISGAGQTRRTWRWSHASSLATWSKMRS